MPLLIEAINNCGHIFNFHRRSLLLFSVPKETTIRLISITQTIHNNQLHTFENKINKFIKIQ